MRMRVTASNVVFIVISLILVIILGLNANAYWTEGVTSFRAAIPIILFCVSIGGLLLNHIHRFLASRLIFFLFWTIFITAFPVWRTPTLYAYFLHPVFGIISSTMVLIMFSFRKEKVFYLLFMIFSMLITVFSFEFVSWFDQEGVSATILTYTTRFRLHFYPFLFTVFFNLVLIYIFRINARFFELQQQQHETIASQNRQLSEARLKLELTNNELEARVRERTLELLEQNTRLTEYGFLHAHVLRAAVSRIRGLLNLMELPIDPEEKENVRNLLLQSMKELDDAVHAMNDKLQAVDNPNPHKQPD